MIRRCAWCGKILGETPTGEGITHGICAPCMDAMFASAEDDEEALACGDEPIHEEYIPSAEWPEPRAPEYVPGYIVRRERDEEREREMMDADGYDWETEPVSAHTQAARV